MQKIFLVSKIFTGDEWLHDHAIITNNGVVETIVPQSDLDRAEAEDYNQFMFVPPFIDAQVYGAGKRLFAAYPDVETLQLMYETFYKEGTTLFVPTVATNTIGLFKKCIDAVREYWRQGGEGVHGLHLEGPWLNRSKRGAHVEKWIHPPSADEVKDLLDYDGQGIISMITVAPEVCNDEIIELISRRNIIVSAGHSNATYQQAMHAFENHVTTVTHLYNAMSPLHHREPGLVGATLQHERVRSSIIPDGYHVDYAAIAIAKKIMNERLFAITDAVTETSTGPYQHYLVGDKYECNDILSGSALSMHKAFLNLINHAGIDETEALRMCTVYPAIALGCVGRYGKIAPARRGQFLVMDKQLAIVDVITL